MAPAMEWIEDYFEESHLLAANSNAIDTAIGHLLAFGTAVGHRDRTISVAAYARGDTGSDLGMASVLLGTRGVFF